MGNAEKPFFGALPGTIPTDASHINDSVDHFVTFPIRHDLRVVLAKFSVELDATDWEEATEGDYEAIVIFSLTNT
ncbi:MAG: hypothetical protein CVV52_07935 [Spirochaetae bacterium HGW-Spirochaetae-8]|jgi:hypothetical protein|nr:MAG: hypothetical protein CVV52_07935 [Spirochaetae bacterium HGW-Spirochaetae-8]